MTLAAAIIATAILTRACYADGPPPLVPLPPDTLIQPLLNPCGPMPTRADIPEPGSALLLAAGLVALLWGRS
jgi:hypothetical protein